MVCAREVSLIESGGTIKVKTHDEGRDAKPLAPLAACVALLQTGDRGGDVLRGDQVLHSQPVALAFHLGPVDDYPCVSSEAGECHADIIIQSTDLPHCPFILQFGH